MAGFLTAIKLEATKSTWKVGGTSFGENSESKSVHSCACIQLFCCDAKQKIVDYFMAAMPAMVGNK
jgi:hypothetical protein